MKSFIKIKQTKYPWHSLSYNDDGLSNPFINKDFIDPYEELKNDVEAKNDQIEVRVFLNLIKETFEYFDIGFECKNNEFKNEITVLLAEVFQPDRIDNNSKTILYSKYNKYESEKDEKKEAENIFDNYYNIIDSLEKGKKWTLSNKKEWYFGSKIWITHIYNENGKKNVEKEKKLSNTIYFYKKILDKNIIKTESSTKIAIIQDPIKIENQIEKFIEEYSISINKEIFSKNENNYFIYIPIGLNTVPNASHDKIIVASTFLHFSTIRPIENLRQVVGFLFQNINTLVNTFYTSEAFATRQEEINRHATRAAISQVMARNMSHNIGSHVLSKMVTVESVRNKYKKDNDHTYISLFDNLYLDKNKTFNDDNYLIANFNSYLRTRMDFLADIATGEPAMEVSRLLVRDVIGELDKNRILLNNISGVDGFKYEIIVKDCRECEENCANDSCKCNGLDKDIPVSIPNGILGYHSLFVIIENVIRNTAKHQGQDSSGEDSVPPPIVFTIELHKSENNNTYYEVLIYDSIPITEDFKIKPDDIKFIEENTNETYRVENSLFKTKLDWLVFQQNCRINKSVISSESGRLREGSWGLVEMDASSAYLRKQSPASIDEKKYDLQILDNESRYDKLGGHLNILKAVKKNNFLAYRFHIMKPKELLIVDEKGILYNELSKDNGLKLNLLRENGIWVFHKNKESYGEENLFNIEKIYSHPFLLIIACDSFNEEEYLFTKVKANSNGEDVECNLFRGNLPTRIIVCNSNKVKISNTIWVATTNEDHSLYKSLFNSSVDQIIRKIPASEADLKSQTIMDMVWGLWLEHKVTLHDLNIVEDYSGSSLGKNINELILNKAKQKGKDFRVFLDHHGREIANHLKKSEKPDSYICYNSVVKDFVDNAQTKMINRELNIKFDKIGLAIITDSALTKIIIIDERVQKSWSEEFDYSKEIKDNVNRFAITKQELMEGGGVFSPIMKGDDELNLNNPRFEKGYSSKLTTFIKYIHKKTNIKGIDFIVIHLGVIEKMLAVEGEPKKKENILNFILNLQNGLGSANTRIIITSGRGKPDNLPEQVPFLSFSTLSQYTIETPFKPLLNEIINNARIFKNK
ncbi:hypothetical protein [Flavobacterium sp. UBA6031]|uniref:hypothetical protein n=1 Tax=Flavobacterium sp. UBA6031 TaxID=1946551 RepID=UPI0025B86433|nr:hypothetical protein [Flavobacterium sp. UBA6031]